MKERGVGRGEVACSLAKRAKDRREKEEVLHGIAWPYLLPANNNK
jgi:hypothetical protein